MVEFFASSLVDGFFKSSFMGKGIVLVQLASSIVMVAAVIGKWRQLAAAGLRVPEPLPVEIDPAYALDAAGLAAAGLLLRAAD